MPVWSINGSKAKKSLNVSLPSSREGVSRKGTSTATGYCQGSSSHNSIKRDDK